MPSRDWVFWCRDHAEYQVTGCCRSFSCKADLILFWYHPPRLTTGLGLWAKLVPLYYNHHQGLFFPHCGLMWLAFIKGGFLPWTGAVLSSQAAHPRSIEACTKTALRYPCSVGAWCASGKMWRHKSSHYNANRKSLRNKDVWEHCRRYWDWSHKPCVKLVPCLSQNKALSQTMSCKQNWWI